MNKFSGKITLSQVFALSITTLSLSGCSNTLDRLFDAPPPEPQATMAPLEDRPIIAERATSHATPSSQLEATPEMPQAALRNVLGAWREAWAERNVEAYLAFYAPGFKGNETTPEKWQANRRRVIGLAKKIELGIGEPQIMLNDTEHATLTFAQKYHASNKRDAGTKTLHLRKIDGRWLIEQESFVATGR